MDDMEPYIVTVEMQVHAKHHADANKKLRAKLDKIKVDGKIVPYEITSTRVKGAQEQAV